MLPITLKDKVIFITGAGGGIGRPTALLCAQAGANVVCCEGPKGEAAGKETLNLLKEIGGKGIYLTCDLLNDESCKNTLDKAIQSCGKIDAVCYIAGVVSTLGIDADISCDIEDPNYISTFVGQFDLHAGGPVRLMKYLIPQMIANGGGTFLTMSSIAAELPAFGKIPYDASKGAVTALAKSIACTYGDKGIVSIPIMPNRVGTKSALDRANSSAQAAAEMGSTQLSNQMITPEEVAKSFVYLLWNGRAHNGDPFYITDGAMSGLRPSTQALLKLL
ncbi:MAG: SDR family oxidoreductase [Proteobacteria bacterium]|nr:SDR family oxidoreductase [Pseudomonadota bacterium]